jgi:hypothetical protein
MDRSRSDGFATSHFHSFELQIEGEPPTFPDCLHDGQPFGLRRSDSDSSMATRKLGKPGHKTLYWTVLAYVYIGECATYWEHKRWVKICQRTPEKWLLMYRF